MTGRGARRPPPGSYRCEHAPSCLMLMYDTAHKPEEAPSERLTAARSPLQVDGMDVLCVREATRFAAEHCRAGKVTPPRAAEYRSLSFSSHGFSRCLSGSHCDGAADLPLPRTQHERPRRQVGHRVRLVFTTLLWPVFTPSSVLSQLSHAGGDPGGPQQERPHLHAEGAHAGKQHGVCGGVQGEDASFQTESL